jgi:hypothetical protein
VLTAERLQRAVAGGITTVWVIVVLAAVVNPDLVTLAGIITPVMLAPAGWLYTDVFIRSRRDLRDDEPEQLQRRR